MTRFRVVLAAVATVFFILVAPTAVAPFDYFRTAINFKQSVQLGDGSVLPAGRYDVQIHFKGTGSVAEFDFLQGGVVKGRQRGEARGFPAAGGGTLAPAAAQQAYKDASLKITNPGAVQDKTSPLSPQYKEQATASKIETNASKVESVKIESLDKDHKTWTSPGQAHGFSWGAAGFGPGTQLKQTAGGGTLRLELDSSNSPAGVIAILKLLPAVQKSPMKK